ncbi:hypothetical protein BH11ARM1_BH11ARM1_11100 [soil metagenome]
MRRLVFALATVGILAGCTPVGGLQVGYLAPDFEVNPVGTKSSDSVKLSDLKGKVVLVDFWATWCGPCIASMPMVETLYQLNHDKGFTVMAISGESSAEIEAFLKENPKDYPFFTDPGEVAELKYKVDAIPRTFLIGRDGTILYEQTGEDPSGLQAAVDSALKS